MDSLQRDAWNHIAEIRGEYFGPTGHVQDNLMARALANSLVFISNKIHHKQSHFLGEVLQNFDDAKYEHVGEPSVTFTLTDGHFSAWSNENGFNLTNVNSICDIHNSSKTGDVQSTGENGAGFKSVFKVAGRVTILSYPYSFAFDTASDLGKLGMLVPAWVDHNTRPGAGTTINFQLKRDRIVRTSLLDQLRAFDYFSLLFLRNIRKIQISINAEGTSFESTAVILDGNMPFTKQVRVTQTSGGYTTTTEHHFVVWTTISRPAIRVENREWPTVLKFAFPFTKHNGTASRSAVSNRYKTYAFQGIQDFGFSFMFHADFILDASRSHVEADQQWNMELLPCIEDATVDAFYWLATNSASNLTVQWPVYLGFLSRVTNVYFWPIVAAVKERLRCLPLVRVERPTLTRERGPSFCAPKGAIIVESRFRCNNKHNEGPLLDSPDELLRVVSGEFAADHQKRLVELGATIMDDLSFSRYFAMLVDNYPIFFRTKTAWWHSTVASILLRHPIISTLRRDLNLSRIVPLENGSWTVARPDKAYLPGQSGVPIPSGFEVSTVTSEASDDPSRRHLFKALGLQRCNPEQVHKLILAAHRQQYWTADHMMEQIVYLFLTGYQPRNMSFTFLTSYSTLTSGSVVLLSKAHAGLFDALFRPDPEIMWMHDSYRKPGAIRDGLEGDWLEWIRRWPNVLNHVPAADASGSLSQEYKRLHSRIGSTKLLRLFRNHPALPLHNLTWCRSVGNLQVATSHGLKRLCDTALPLLAAQASGFVPLIDLEEPEADWSFLHLFGVCVSVDRAFLLRQLKCLQARREDDMLASAQIIYEKLGHSVEDQLGDSQLTNEFRSARLILLPDGSWCGIDNVRWKSNFRYTLQTVLRDCYSSRCRRLFVNILGVKDTGLQDLIAEISHQSVEFTSHSQPEVAVGNIRDLLEKLDGLMDKAPAPSTIAQLRNLGMFPVTMPSGGWQLQSAHLGEFWIPDIPVLHECFQGRAPLLEMSSDSLGVELANVVTRLGLKDILLTNAVHSQFESGTEVGVEDHELARLLRSKAEYIRGILEAEGKSQHETTGHVSRIKRLKVSRTSQIYVERRVVGKEREYQGKQSTGDATCTIEDNALRVLLRKGIQTSNVVPPLRKAMAKFLGISKYEALLGDVIATDDPEGLKEDLQRAGAYVLEAKSVSSIPQTEQVEDAEDSEPESCIPESMASERNVPLDKTNNLRPVQTRRLSVPHTRAEFPDEGSTEKEVVRITHQDESSLRSASVIELPGNNFNESTSGSEYRRLRRSAGHGPRSPSISNAASTRESPQASETDDGLVSAMSKVSITPRGRKEETSRSASRLAEPAHVAEHVDLVATTSRGNLERHARSLSPLGQEQNVLRQSRQVPSQGNFLSPSVPWARSSRNMHRRSWDGASEPLQDQTSSHEAKRIGAKGEHIVYEFLRTKLGASFGEKHWTSNGRKAYIPNTCPVHRPQPCPLSCARHFTIDEGRYADFTIVDSVTSQAFTQYLRSRWSWGKSVESNTNYHIEVKSTTRLEGESSFWTFSPNQLRMARQWSASLALQSVALRDVYVLVRVFDIDGDEPKLWFVIDPWASIWLECVSPLQMRPVADSRTRSLESTSSHMQPAAQTADDNAPARRSSVSFLDAISQTADGAGTTPKARPWDFTFESARSFPIHIALGKTPSARTVPITIWSKVSPVTQLASSGTTEVMQSICATEKFAGYSFEELRLADEKVLESWS